MQFLLEQDQSLEQFFPVALSLLRYQDLGDKFAGLPTLLAKTAPSFNDRLTFSAVTPWREHRGRQLLLVAGFQQFESVHPHYVQDDQVERFRFDKHFGTGEITSGYNLAVIELFLDKLQDIGFVIHG
jgi:hypothetical protein